MNEGVGRLRGKDVLELLVFSVSLVSLILFTYLNIYSLPLGVTSPGGAVQNAPNLYGLDIEIGGELSFLTDFEFKIIDPDTSQSIKAIWVGDGDLPLNGTMVIAGGLIAPSQVGPVLRCDKMSSLQAANIVFDNPWGLPSLRLVTVVLLWFTINVVMTGLMSLAHMLRPRTFQGDRMKALSEIGSLSGVALMVCLASFMVLEFGLGGGIGIPTIAIVVSFSFMLLSVIMRWTNRQDVAEISNALPIAAALIALIGVSMIAVQQQLFSSDLLGAAISTYLPGFVIAATVGVAGFALMGVFMAERKYYAITIKGMLKLGKDEVR